MGQPEMGNGIFRLPWARLVDAAWGAGTCPLLVVGGETPARAMLNDGGLCGEMGGVIIMGGWVVSWGWAVVLLAFQAALLAACAAKLHTLRFVAFIAAALLS